MSRKIDLTKPLSDEDREYLLIRCRTNDLALNEQYLAGDHPSGEDVVPPVTDSPHAGDASPQAIAASAAARARQTAADGPESGTDTPEGSAAASDEPADNYDDEDAWSYDDLKVEAKSANETLPEEQRIALNQSRADIIAALRQYDATYDASDEDDEQS